MSPELDPDFETMLKLYQWWQGVKKLLPVEPKPEPPTPTRLKGNKLLIAILEAKLRQSDTKKT